LEILIAITMNRQFWNYHNQWILYYLEVGNCLKKDDITDINFIQIVTFYENNQCAVKIIFQNTDEVFEQEYRWSTSFGKLIFPDGYDYRTNRFAEYDYSFSDDGNLLYANFNLYPFVGIGPYTLEGRNSPLGINNGIFKRLEVVK